MEKNLQNSSYSNSSPYEKALSQQPVVLLQRLIDIPKSLTKTPKMHKKEQKPCPSNKNNHKFKPTKSTYVGQKLGNVNSDHFTNDEIEMVLDCRFRDEEDQYYYLVKWRGFRLKLSNWIPESEFKEDTELLDHYKSIFIGHSVSEETFRYFVEDLLTGMPQDTLVLGKFASLLFPVSEKDILKLGLSFHELVEKVRGTMCKHLGVLLRKQHQHLLDLIRFAQSRKQVLISLGEFEDTMNTSLPTKMLYAENNVDLELAPTNFEFITEYISSSVVIGLQPLIYCTCMQCSEDCKECCPPMADAPFPFSRQRRLQLHAGYPIQECNSKCKCGPDCPNRVTQQGRTFKTAVFRTQDGRGWGLKALQEIGKDRFVTEYLGEVVTSAEAECRNTTYQKEGKFYLFDLDYNTQRESTYTVDATLYGNESRFINHSCEPNLSVFSVWVDCPDPFLPRLAFFARRTIQAGEELTIDYRMDCSRERRSGDEEIVVRLPCKCRSRKCRDYLF